MEKRERSAHYNFFRIPFNYSVHEEIENNFKREPVGVPYYGFRKKSAAIDMVYAIVDEKWIAIEMELTGAGKDLEKELIKCVDRLKSSPECERNMSSGFIVPLIAR